MSDKSRRRWVGWIFLGWTAVVLGVYLRQLLDNAAALGLSPAVIIERLH